MRLDPVQARLTFAALTDILPAGGGRAKCGPNAVLPLLVHQNLKFSAFVFEWVGHIDSEGKNETIGCRAMQQANGAADVEDCEMDAIVNILHRKIKGRYGIVDLDRRDGSAQSLDRLQSFFPEDRSKRCVANTRPDE
jgi:hypothetical protein